MRILLVCLTVGILFSAATKAQEKINTGKGADLSLTASGRQHHAIKTKNREAQDYFDQGITLIYGFS